MRNEFARAAALAIGLSLLAGAAAAQERLPLEDIETARRAAAALVRDGHRPQAVPLLERAAAIAERDLPPHHPRRAEAIGELAYTYFILERHGDAEQAYQRLLALFARDPARPDGDIWLALQRLAMVYDRLERRDEAQAFLARAHAIEARVAAPYDVAIAPQEIITNDLQRVRLTDCGTIRFAVDDAQKLLMLTGSVARMQRHNAVVITSVLRRVLGGRTLAQIREQTDTIAQEVTRRLDSDLAPQGVSAREIRASFSACAVPIVAP